MDQYYSLSSDPASSVLWTLEPQQGEEGGPTHGFQFPPGPAQQFQSEHTLQFPLEPGGDADPEQEKVAERRERNRLAATRCREKKKEKLQLLTGRAELLERSNNSLRQDCYRLEAEKRYLVRMLMDRRQEEQQAGQEQASLAQVEQASLAQASSLLQSDSSQDIYSVIENFTQNTSYPTSQH